MSKGDTLRDNTYTCPAESCTLCLTDSGYSTRWAYCTEEQCTRNADNDQDFDGILDDQDSCPNHWNRLQEDLNQDGIGDACDGIDDEPEQEPQTTDPEIEARLAALEAWKTSADSDISILKAWKDAVQATLDSIQSDLAQIKSWLSFSSFNNLCEATSICGSSESECNLDEDCGTDGFIGTKYCDSGDVYQVYRDYYCNTNCFYDDTITQVQDCESNCVEGQCVSYECTSDDQCGVNYECEDNKCVQTQCSTDNDCSSGYRCLNTQCTEVACTEDTNCNTGYTCDNYQCVQQQASQETVVFRTNSNGDYSRSNVEIAVDYDGDGSLECYKYYTYYKTYRSRTPDTIVQTPQGYKVNKFGVPAEKQIIIARSPNYIYKPGTCTIPLDSTPQTPYSTNGQEVLESS